MIAVLCAVLSAAVGLPGQAAAAGEPGSYDFDPEAERIQGATGGVGAPELAAGTTYRSDIGPGEQLRFRVVLDDSSAAYVSAVAVPGQGGQGGQVDYSDGIEVTLQDRNGSRCDRGDASFGSTTYRRPLVGVAERLIGQDADACQEAGAYDVVIERTTDSASARESWDLELRLALEPGLKAGDASAAPGPWSTALPEPVGGTPSTRAGGAGFVTATSLAPGVWQDSIRPGETRFFRVPVDWGQQLFAGAELGSCGSGSRSGLVSRAFAVELVNPAGAPVASDTALYNCRPASADLDPLPPVDYRNRYGKGDQEQQMRFAGWYYLKVSLNPEVGEKYGDGARDVTLRVNVRGTAEDEPGYVRDPGIFQVTEQDTKSAQSGSSGSGALEDSTMKVVAAAGIGTGTVLVLGLGVWTVVARRGARGLGAGTGSDLG